MKVTNIRAGSQPLGQMTRQKLLRSRQGGGAELISVTTLGDAELFLRNIGLFAVADGFGA